MSDGSTLKLNHMFIMGSHRKTYLLSFFVGDFYFASNDGIIFLTNYASSFS